MGVSPGLPLKCGGMTATSRSTVPRGTFGGMVTVSSGLGAVLFRESAAPPAPAPAAENACGSEVATASGVGEIVDASAWGWPSAGGAGACAAAPGAAGAALGAAGVRGGAHRLEGHAGDDVGAASGRGDAGEPRVDGDARPRCVGVRPGGEDELAAGARVAVGRVGEGGHYQVDDERGLDQRDPPRFTHRRPPPG